MQIKSLSLLDDLNKSQDTEFTEKDLADHNVTDLHLDDYLLEDSKQVGGRLSKTIYTYYVVDNDNDKGRSRRAARPVFNGGENTVYFYCARRLWQESAPAWRVPAPSSAMPNDSSNRA